MEFPSSYVVTFNISKKHNIGTIARACTAFDVKGLCLVGSREYNSFGSHGSDAYVKLMHFNSLDECCNVLRKDHSCQIVGIEIEDYAQPVHKHPFSGNTAFLLGNEGQYGSGTASLNVAVACSIVLHHFAIWAGYEEREREGEKFVVAEKPQRNHSRGCVPPTELEREKMLNQRRNKKQVLDSSDEDLAQEFTAVLQM